MNRLLTVFAVALATMLSGCGGTSSPAAPTASSTTTFVDTRTPIYVVAGVVRDSTSSQPLDKVRVDWAFLAEDHGERGAGTSTNGNGAYRVAIYSPLVGRVRLET